MISPDCIKSLHQKIQRLWWSVFAISQPSLCNCHCSLHLVSPCSSVLLPFCQAWYVVNNFQTRTSNRDYRLPQRMHYGRIRICRLPHRFHRCKSVTAWTSEMVKTLYCLARLVIVAALNVMERPSLRNEGSLQLNLLDAHDSKWMEVAKPTFALSLVCKQVNSLWPVEFFKLSENPCRLWWKQGSMIDGCKSSASRRWFFYVQKRWTSALSSSLRGRLMRMISQEGRISVAWWRTKMWRWTTVSNWTYAWLSSQVNKTMFSPIAHRHNSGRINKRWTVGPG